MKIQFSLILAFVFVFSYVNANALDPNDPSIVGVWLFDDGSGTTVADSSGDNDGTINGDFTWDTGKFGGAIVAAGGGDITVPPSDSLNSVADALTIAAWFRVDADSDTGIRRQNAYLLEDQSDTEPVPNAFSFRIWTDQGLSPGFYGQTELTQGQWYHIAGTYDGTNVEMYVDGEPESAKGALSDAGADWTPEWGGAVGTPGDSLQLKYASESLTGAIDEIVLFNRALSEAEVKALMNGFSNLTAVDVMGKLSITWGHIKAGH